MSRLGLADSLVETLKNAVASKLDLPPCGMPGCDKLAPHAEAMCRMCGRHTCVKHGFLRLDGLIIGVICASCVIDENDDLLEDK